MPTLFPEEFRRDVTARRGGRSRADIARSVGLSECCFGRRLKLADRDDGRDDGKTAPSGDPVPTVSVDLEVENGDCVNEPSSTNRRTRSSVG